MRLAISENARGPRSTRTFAHREEAFSDGDDVDADLGGDEEARTRASSSPAPSFLIVPMARLPPPKELAQEILPPMKDELVQPA